MPDDGASPVPAPGELQFQIAEPLPAGDPSAQHCVACRAPIAGQYFHAQGQVVCPLCADRIQTGQQAAPKLSLLRAALYGGGAALGGSILYATVVLVTGYELALMAILVGYLVGRAVRYASYGRGGRPQQILAVALTYFGITTSYIPVFVSAAMKERPAQTAQNSPRVTAEPEAKFSPGKALVFVLLLAAAAPFFSLSSGFSGLLGLFIIFIGLSRAWRMTARSELLVMGPYEVTPAP